MKLLHWNIHGWRDADGQSNRHRVTNLITRINPDIVTLTEVDETYGLPGDLDVLAADTGYPYVFFPAFEFGATAPRGAFGNAILTRMPILAARHRGLIWPVPAYDGSEPSEPRSVTFIRAAAQGHPVTIAVTHLPRKDASLRDQAAARLREIFDADPGHWVLAGDFNMPPAWASDLASAPDPPVPTAPAHNPREPIDYVITSSSLAAHASALNEDGSDHLPVLAAIGFR